MQDRRSVIEDAPVAAPRRQSSAEATALLQHQCGQAGPLQRAGGGQAGDAGTDDEDVGFGRHAPVWTIADRPCPERR